MKCLSVSQPFASLIVSGRKTIELRGWNTHFRGEFLVHAPLKIRVADCRRLKIGGGKLATGAIVGKAEIYGVKRYGSAGEVRRDGRLHRAGADHHTKRYGFMLRNPKPFRIPIPWKGRLGFFDVELPRSEVKDSEIVSEIIDEEYRYQWIGHH